MYYCKLRNVLFYSIIVTIFISFSTCPTVFHTCSVIENAKITTNNKTSNISSLKVIEEQNQILTLKIENGHFPRLCQNLFANFQNIHNLTLTEIDISVIEIGAFNHLNSLKILELDENFIGELKPGIFDNLTKIREINLMTNTLKEININVFNNSTVKLLYLSYNPISIIKDGAFDNMPKLTTLELRFTHLKEISPDWYHNVPKLRKIDFGLSKIVKVPEDAFKNLDADGLEISFMSNDLTDVHKNALNGLKNVKKISFARNKLQSFDLEFQGVQEAIQFLNLGTNNISCLNFANVKVKSLKIVKNPLREQCKMELKKWSIENNITIELE